MWRVFLFLFSINFFTISVLEAQTVSNYIDEIVDAEQKHFQYKDFKQNQLTNSYDVTYYRLQLTINPDVKYIEGSVVVHFIPNQDLNQLVFDLSDALVLDSVRSNTQGAYSHADNQIAYNQSFVKGVLDSVTIYYHGEPKASGAFEQNTHDNQSIIWTLSEPYGVMEWWPCKQSLTDKADSLDMFLTVPVGNKAASNGNLVSQIINGSQITYHWQTRYPIVPYLVALAVTPYAEISFYSQLQEGSLFVQNYVYKEDSAFVLDELLATDTLLRLYDDLVGPYPFMNEKYGHAQFGRGGGMEHQTMSFMFHFGFSLNAHELAHQWFGDKITCGTWSDIWLNEGFATYFTGIAYENLRSDSLWFEWKRAVLEKVVSEPGGSVYVVDTTNVGRMFDSRLTYRKGAYILHTLRFEVGDEAFFEAVRNYLLDPNLAYKTALTDDFFKHVETAYGFDLTWFKTEWVYGEGYPSYNLEWSQANGNVEFTLNQTTSHSSVPFFHNRVPILCTNSNGDSAMIEVIPSMSENTFVFPVGFEIEEVIIDPNLDIISKGNFTINSNRITGFKIYPNPASDILFINPGNEHGRFKSYEVYSANGQLIMLEPNYNQYQGSSIDVSKLPTGMYSIVFKGSSSDVLEKFVISR